MTECPWLAGGGRIPGGGLLGVALQLAIADIEGKDHAWVHPIFSHEGETGLRILRETATEIALIRQ